MLKHKNPSRVLVISEIERGELMDGLEAGLMAVEAQIDQEAAERDKGGDTAIYDAQISRLVRQRAHLANLLIALSD